MWVDIQQNTDEWLERRAGKVGGSSIGKIMAFHKDVYKTGPRKGQPKDLGEGAQKLAAQIAIEQITGKPILSSYTNEHMERGHEQEPIAKALYGDMFFCDVTHGGMYDNGRTGVSPDGLVYDDGMVEVKSVIHSVQMETIKRGGIDPKYKWQCRFELKESGREWLDYVSFCADFPEDKRLFVHRLTKGEAAKHYPAIDRQLDRFWGLVEENKKLILAL